MNKLFKGVLGTSLCLAAALGVGIGIASSVANKAPVTVKADAGSVTFVAGTDKSDTTTLTKAPITISVTGGTFSRDDNYRCYAGKSMTISSAEGYLLSSIEFTFSGANTGGWSTSYTGLTSNSWTSATTTAQARITQLVVNYTTTSVEKHFNITGVTSSGLYLKTETYDIGYEAVGFDEAPTITDVVWTVPDGAGAIADGHWTAGAEANDNVTLGLDLKADGDAYHAEVTTKIDEITEFKKNAPKTQFSPDEAFTVGSNFKLVYKYAASEGSVLETDEGISYRLEDLAGNKLKDVVYNSTKFTAEESGNYIDATYKGVDLSERYSITVVELFNNTNGAYYLVSDESELKDGDHVTLYGHYKNDKTEKSFVASSVGSKNIQGSLVNFDHEAIDAKQSFTVLDFVLVDTSKDLEGSFAFSISNDSDNLAKYLYAAASGDNYLKTQKDIDKNARFVIDIDEGLASIVATGSTNRNIMSANGTNTSTLFSCYTGVQANSDLHLYKWVSNQDKLDEFVASKMAMDKTVENQCLTLYPLAKEAFNNLTASQKQLFVDESGEGQRYHDAYARLAAWAAAHGDIISTSGASSYNLKAGLPAGGLNGITVGIITTISVITVVGVGAVIVLHKKKRIR